MFKTVLFDLDGTLLNTIDDLADSANRVCKAHGWPEHDTAQYKYFVGNGIPKLVERFSPEDQRDPKTLQKTLAEFDTVYGAHMHDKTAPYPGMPELLAKLQKNGVKMTVFSNKADEFARAVVARYFDSSLFEIVRGALPDVPTKPAPQGTCALMKKLGVTARAGKCSTSATATWMWQRPITPGCPAAACYGASARKRNCSRPGPSTWPRPCKTWKR